MSRDDTGWPLVGRSAELELISEARNAGRSVFIAGAPGVGKTMLTRAAIADAADAGIRSCWAAASRSARSIPLGAMAHLIPSDAVGEQAHGADLLAAMVAVLTETHPTALLVGVDDAHFLDDASATLVRLLATTEGTSVILNVRAGEALPDAIAGLPADGTAERIDLHELSEPDVRPLLAELLGAPVDRATARRLWASTRGNPLFLHELVRALRSSGALTCESGWWRWTGPFPTGTTARSLIEARTAHLDAAQRAGLEAVAHGEPIEVDIAEQLVDPATLAGLEESGLIEVTGRGDRLLLRTAHPLYGEAVRAATPISRARPLRRSLAEAVADRPQSSPTDQLRAAVWLLDSGEEVPVALLVDAARWSWASGDASLAERLARRAVGSDRDHEARYLLGEALADLGRFDDALAAWAAIQETAAEPLRAEAARARAEITGHVLGRRSEAITILDRALSGMNDGAARQRLLAARAVFLAHQGAVDEAASSAAALLDDSLSPDTELQALLATLPLEVIAGHLTVVEQQLPRAHAAATGAAPSSPNAQLWVGLLAFAVDLYQGRLEAAEARAGAELEAALGRTHPVGRGYWTEALGLVALRRGQPLRAGELFEEAIAIYGTYANGARRGGLVSLALAHGMAGDGDGATAALAEADAEVRSAPVWLVDPESARAWALAATGQLTAAAQLAADAAAAARRRAATMHELQLLHDLARFGDPRQARSRTTELAGAVDGAWAEAVTAHIIGLAASDDRLLAEAAAGFDAQGAQLDAAEAWAAAATVARAAGRTTVAHGASRRAEAARSLCPGARTPGLAFARWDDTLTAREREIAMLVARGQADKEVAAKLGISVRTVNAHLRSVYMKLGVEGRGDIVVALGESAT